MPKYKIIKNKEYFFPIIVLIAFLIIIYPTINSLYKAISYSEKTNMISNKVSDLPRNLYSNDNLRVNDLEFFSRILENYLRDNGRYPVAIEMEKISEENSNVFQTLKNEGYLFKVRNDPSAERYYGYKSDGNFYELSAVLENSEDSRCAIEGNYCIYRLKKKIPKCEFSNEINNLTKSGDVKNENSFKGKEGNIGLLRRAMAHYQNIKEPNKTSYASIYIMEFNNQTAAEKYLQAIKKSTECNMAGIQGRCIKWYTGQSYGYKVKGMDFVWQEFNIIKQIHVLEQGSAGDINFLEQRAKGRVSYFASQFRNCKL